MADHTLNARSSFDKSDLRWGLLVLLLSICVHAAFVRVGIDNPPRDGHEFRQTQTALTAYWIQKEGWSMDPPLPLFGPHWTAPLEFPIYQLVTAKVSRLFGTSLEPTARVVSLVFLYLALPAVFLLAGRLPLNAGQRLVLLSSILLTPIYLFFGRAISIESSALCFAAWFVWGFVRLLEKPGAVLYAFTLLVGSCAALSKITTFAVALVPVTLLFVGSLWSHRSDAFKCIVRKHLGPGVVTLTALAVGAAWIYHGDAVKASNPLSAFLTSSGMAHWTYGELKTRFTAAFWHDLTVIVDRDLLVYGNLILALLLWVASPAKYRWLGLALIAGFLSGPLVFSNLYLIHNYYFFANGVLILALLVIGWSRLLDLAGPKRHWGWLAVMLSLGLQAHGFYSGWYQMQRDSGPARPDLAAVVNTVTEADEIIVLVGQDWNPSIPYFAERKAIMPRDGLSGDWTALREVLARVDGAKIGALIVTSHYASTLGEEASLARELGLQSQPVLEKGEDRIYLRANRANALVWTLPDHKRKAFTINDILTSEIPGISLKRFPVDALPERQPVMRLFPQPSEVLAPFGVSGTSVEGEIALNIHAPTEVVIPLPVGAIGVELEFGMHEAAYAEGNWGDGVTFSIEFLPQDDLDRKELWQEALNPFLNGKDRGIHRKSLSFQALPAGTAFLRVTPGPAQKIEYDWAYWRLVRWQFAP